MTTQESTKAELVSWETLRQECKYPTTDNNNGLTFGLAYVENDNIIDYEWFGSEEARNSSIKENNIIIINND